MINQTLNFSFNYYNSLSNEIMLCNLPKECTNDIMFLIQQEFAFKNQIFLACTALFIITNLFRYNFKDFYDNNSFIFGIVEGFTMVYSLVWLIDLIISPF